MIFLIPSFTWIKSHAKSNLALWVTTYLLQVLDQLIVMYIDILLPQLYSLRPRRSEHIYHIQDLYIEEPAEMVQQG